MEETDLSEQTSQLELLASLEKYTELIELIDEMPSASVVDFLLTKDIDFIINILKMLEPETAGRIYSDFNVEKQREIFEGCDKTSFSLFFANMYSDIRADLFQDFSKEEQIAIFPYLDKKTREDVIVLSAYPPETAGGIMSTDFATIMINMNVSQALAKIRKDAPSQKMIYYIYVVDQNMILQGMVTLKDLVMNDISTPISELYNEFFVFADVNDDRESVALKIEKFDLVAIPVLNSLKQLVGIISHEEAIDVLMAEHTEDMEKFMGIVPSIDEQTYLDTSSFAHFKKRVWWVVSLAAVGFISGMIIHHFQVVLEQLIILALYMPMMTATGGNIGSQSATVVIRALSLGEIEDRVWFKIIFKEAKISFLLSLGVGSLVFIKIAFLSSIDLLPPNFTFTFVGLIIALAMSVQVITSAVIGAGLPLLVRRFGGDPAVAASPAITTMVDITGLLIYFSIASAALNV
jgi:magnesium transporter